MFMDILHIIYILIYKLMHYNIFTDYIFWHKYKYYIIEVNTFFLAYRFYYDL